MGNGLLIRTWLAAAILAGPVSLLAQEAVPAWLSPYEGSTLRQSQVLAFDEYLRVVGTVAPATDALPQGVERLEGKVTRLRFDNPKSRSTLEMARNYRLALEAQGFQVDHECARSTSCGNLRQPSWMSLNGINLGAAGDVRYFTGRLAVAGSPVFVSVALNPQVTYVHVVEVASLQQGMVRIQLDELVNAIESDGRVELPGVHFDSGTARLQAASGEALGAAAELMRQWPSLQIEVVGHTDSQGSEAANLLLSQQRAAAVIEALVARGIASERMAARGMGATQSVADNSTETGRARNRRVELVRR